MDPSIITPETPAIPPPPEVTSNFVNPETHDTALIVLHTLCLTLTTLFIVMRVYTRHFISHWLSWDDYLCLFAYALNVVFSGLLLGGLKIGFGRHLWDIRAIHAVETFKLLFVVENMYIPLVTVLKLVFLLFFERVFSPSPKLRYLTRGGMAAILIFYFTIFFRSIFLCDPVQKAYNPALPGHCLKFEILPYTTGVFNIISDFYILFLPLPFIWRLKLETSRKLRLMAVFSVGLFACIASIVRLAMTAVVLNDPDMTWTLSNLSLWTVLEVNVGIICACSLALPAFLDRYWPRRLSAKFSKLVSYLPFTGTNSRLGRSSNASFGPTTGASNCSKHRFPSSSERLRHDTSGLGLPRGSQADGDPHASYAELHEKARMVRLLSGGHGGNANIYTETSVSACGRNEEDMEDWAAAADGRSRGGILMRVDVEQSYPMALNPTPERERERELEVKGGLATRSIV